MSKHSWWDIPADIGDGMTWVADEAHHIFTGDPTQPDAVPNGAAIADSAGGPVPMGSYSSAAIPNQMSLSPMMLSQNPYGNLSPDSLMMNQDLTGTTSDPATQNGQGGNTSDGQQTGGWQQWLKNNTGLTVPQLLGIAGSGLSAWANYNQNANAQKIQQNEFNQQLQLSKNQQEAQLAAAKQRQGVANYAQGLATSQTPPTPFHPVDYTAPGGLNNLNQPASGGAAAQLAANAQAGQNNQGATIQQLLKAFGYTG